MEEMPGHNGAEEYRLIQALVRAGQGPQALERLRHALAEGSVGRKQRALLHSLACRLHANLPQGSATAAVMHGEEAVRLAEQVRNEWIKCEVLTSLVGVYCRLGQTGRAEAACDAMAHEMELNPGALAGGSVALGLQRGIVAEAAGAYRKSLIWLEEAEAACVDEPSDLLVDLHMRRAMVLLRLGRHSEARLLVAEGEDTVADGGSDPLQWELLRAWLALEEGDHDHAVRLLQGVAAAAGPLEHDALLTRCLLLQARAEECRQPDEAERLARLALERAVAAGRTDLVREVRRGIGYRNASG